MQQDTPIADALGELVVLLLLVFFFFLCSKVLTVRKDGDGGACGRNGGLRLGELLVQVRQLRDGVGAVLRWRVSQMRITMRHKIVTEMSGLWLSVLTQYLFHSMPSSSVSRLDLKISTSSW